MRKKVLSGLLLAVSAVLFTGCGNSIELTDQQNSMVAQYAAELLLKYDIRYDYRLEDINSITGELQLEEETKTTQEDTEPESTEEDTRTEEDGKTQENENDDKKETDLSELFKDGIDIKYTGYKILPRYPEDISDVVVYVEPREGMKLIVVEFEVTNTKEEPVSLDYLNNSDRKYRIILNDAKAAVPMQTLLEEDLSSLKVTLLPKETKKAVLVFQISESLENEIQSLKVSVQQGETKHMIILKD